MGFNKQTIRDISVDNKTILVRTDYNVPISSSGAISDDLRIRASLPTLKYLLKHNCKIIIISHLGRPDGKPNPKYTLLPVAKRLGELLGIKIDFISDCIGDKITNAVKKLKPGQILMLENVRFYPGETANDINFARAIADSTGARYFVQDGFGVVHRAHATTSAITHFIPSVAGFLLEKEVIALSEAIDGEKRPLVAVLGGAKVSDKISVIEKLVKSADKILIGGAMANTFLNYRGINLGSTKIEPNEEKTLDKIYELAIDRVGIDNIDEFIILPIDVAVATNPSAFRRRSVPLQSINMDEMVFDIGDATAYKFCKEIDGAKTIIWNGTMGLAENPTFSYGSSVLAKFITNIPGAVSIIGGGDTADFILKWCKYNNGKFHHISTGGGASLDLIAGRKLPGIEALLALKK